MWLVRNYAISIIRFGLVRNLIIFLTYMYGFLIGPYLSLLSIFSANHATRIVLQANAAPTVLLTAATIRTARIATRSVKTTSARSPRATIATTTRTARLAERFVT